MNGQRPGSSIATSGPRVLIIDGHTLFCAGMVRLLESAPGIGEATAATALAEGMRLAARFCPDVVSVDPCLPEAGPFEIARRVRSHCSGWRFLFLDASVREVHVRAALQAGASGYWTKHASFDQVLEAIRDVAAGQPSFCRHAQPYVVATRRRLRFKPSDTTRALGRLTSRELEVLLHLARGLTVRQCAARMHLAANTVDNHKARLMKKLDVHKSVDLATLALREGLID
jgi:DNA-binding NarL/FixJ family response regulator